MNTAQDISAENLVDATLETPQLALLRLLAEQPHVSQRELSRSLGLSLGKTHYVLHALVDKGLVKARNFTRSDNKLGYSYLLTPAGLNAKLRMTRQFLERKEAEFEQLRDTIAALRAEIDNLPCLTPLCDPGQFEKHGEAFDESGDPRRRPRHSPE